MLTSSPPTRVETATEILAADLARAVGETGCALPLARRVAEIDDNGSGQGAVRVTGADVLAPFLLSGRVPDDDDVAVVQASVRVFPAPAPAAVADPVWAARDWALSRVLARFGIDASSWDGLAAIDGDPASVLPSLGTAEPWAPWALTLARLSSLALPGLDGAARDAALSRRTDLVRGLTRSMLRRDHLTAARLARWLAMDCAQLPEPLLAPAIEQLDLLALDEPRTRLELAIARHMMQRES
ncbi:hypothetical protein ACFOVU_19040 [Nocardiopsis sediminis]|uniref:Uncharacterized protein n=1 Tax=Nocardiopsis sediminis TaxID=1778267 RepID=A0ABV8FPE6_9ACTN